MARIQYLAMLIFACLIVLVAASFIPGFMYDDHRLFGIFLLDPAQVIFFLGLAICLALAANFSPKATQVALIITGCILIANSVYHFAVGAPLSRVIIAEFMPVTLAYACTEFDCTFLVFLGSVLVALGMAKTPFLYAPRYH